MIFIYLPNSEFQKQIEYTFMNIFFILGLDYKIMHDINDETPKQDDIVVIYSNTETETKLNCRKNAIIIKQSNKLFGKCYMDVKSIPEKVRHYNSLISIFSVDEELYIHEDFNGGNVIETNMDIISDIFFMLTRYEEVINTEAYKKERFNRFSAAESFAFKNAFLDRPIVNEHVDLLWSFIDKFELGYKKKKWWEDKDFAACLTHDVDYIQKYNSFNELFRISASLFLKYKKPVSAIKIFTNYFRGYKKDPYYTFDYIMKLEDAYSFKSSFYFMAGGNSEFDNNYDVCDAKVINLIQEIENKGFEVGYHSSFNSYNDEDILMKEKVKLDLIINNKKFGCRQHFLRFKAPYTWRIQSKANLLYDTTLSFADAEGFRCGTCFPFKSYDIIENRILEIWEIPLIIMEQTLKSREYKGYTPKQGLEVSKKLIDTVKKHNGVFVLLYHNTSFDYTDKMLEGWEKTFEETLKYLYENNCLGTSGSEIIKFITK